MCFYVGIDVMRPTQSGIISLQADIDRREPFLHLTNIVSSDKKGSGLSELHKSHAIPFARF
jgi:hypothetical protein